MRSSWLWPSVRRFSLPQVHSSLSSRARLEVHWAQAPTPEWTKLVMRSSWLWPRVCRRSHLGPCLPGPGRRVGFRGAPGAPSLGDCTRRSSWPCCGLRTASVLWGSTCQPWVSLTQGSLAPWAQAGAGNPVGCISDLGPTSCPLVPAHQAKESLSYGHPQIRASCVSALGREQGDPGGHTQRCLVLLQCLQAVLGTQRPREGLGSWLPANLHSLGTGAELRHSRETGGEGGSKQAG